MAFRRQFAGDLLSWDRNAPVLLAQILIMGGVMKPDFDTAAFDKKIGRRRGARLSDADALRIMTRALPTLALTWVGTHPTSDFLDPERLRSHWLKAGVKSKDINRYLKTKTYARNCGYLKDLLAASKQLGPRYRENITDRPRPMIERALVHGAVAITADAQNAGGLVMLMSSTRSPGKIRAYFPDYAPMVETMDKLHQAEVIDLDHFGATVHAMS